MNGDFQRPVNVMITREMEDRLHRFCTIHGINKREAVRRAISQMLTTHHTEPPVLDKDVP
jgi:hypothetical protein